MHIFGEIPLIFYIYIIFRGNKRSFEPFVFGSCFRTLAVILFQIFDLRGPVPLRLTVHEHFKIERLVSVAVNTAPVLVSI